MRQSSASFDMCERLTPAQESASTQTERMVSFYQGRTKRENSDQTAQNRTLSPDF